MKYENIVKPSVTRQMIDEYEFYPTHALGQNFLIDGNILNKIIDAADLKPEDRVLEIGPGLGCITEKLVERCSRVVAIEVDRDLYDILQDNFADKDNLELICSNFDEYDIEELMGEKSESLPDWKVCANLPYYMATAILMRLVGKNLPVQTIVITVQLEVAQRMKAPPGGKDYGLLGVFVQSFANVEIVHQVPASVFYPTPEVKSAIVKLDVMGTSRVPADLAKIFTQVVRTVFGQRRKTILNALSAPKTSSYDKEIIANILDEAGIDPERRGETLTIEEFVSISKTLKKNYEGENDGFYKPK